jgi:hypothetical protein
VTTSSGSVSTTWLCIEENRHADEVTSSPRQTYEPADGLHWRPREDVQDGVATDDGELWQHVVIQTPSHRRLISSPAKWYSRLPIYIFGWFGLSQENYTSNMYKHLCHFPSTLASFSLDIQPICILCGYMKTCIRYMFECEPGRGPGRRCVKSWSLTSQIRAWHTTTWNVSCRCACYKGPTIQALVLLDLFFLS